MPPPRARPSTRLQEGIELRVYVVGLGTERGLEHGPPVLSLQRPAATCSDGSEGLAPGEFRLIASGVCNNHALAPAAIGSAPLGGCRHSRAQGLLLGDRQDNSKNHAALGKCDDQWAWSLSLGAREPGTGRC